MLRFAIIAIVAAASAVGIAQTVSSLPPPRPPAAQTQADFVLPPAQASSEPASISKGPDGHYWAEADVDGHEVRFLVDTGATAVALTLEDAERLGIDPASLNYAYSVSTANGQARAAPVTLASVSVAGARVDDVQAYVLDHGLPTSLLGMSYLGRLSQFQATQTSLVLTP
jgi:aspartyl protease family protein